MYRRRRKLINRQNVLSFSGNGGNGAGAPVHPRHSPVRKEKSSIACAPHAWSSYSRTLFRSATSVAHHISSLAAIPAFLGLLDQTSFSSSGSVIPVAFGRTQQFQAVLPVLKRCVKVKDSKACRLSDSRADMRDIPIPQWEVTTCYPSGLDVDSFFPIVGSGAIGPFS